MSMGGFIMRNAAILGVTAWLAMVPAMAGAAGESASHIAGGQIAAPMMPLRVPQAPPASARPPMAGNWGPGGWRDGPPPPHAGGWAGHRGSWGNWAGGGAYQRPGRGFRLPPFYVAPSLFITDWYDYGLGAPGYGQGWYRYYDDAVLLDSEGNVYDARYDMDWDWDRDRGEGWAGPPPSVYRAPPGTTTVVIQSGPTVTTTTTTFVEEVAYSPRRSWKPKAKWRPRKAWHPAPCGCGCACGS